MLSVNEQLQKCRSVIGAEKPEPFAVFWDRSDYKTRLALLRITGEAVYLNNRKWAEISAETRATIKRRSRDLMEWLNKALGGETCPV